MRIGDFTRNKALFLFQTLSSLRLCKVTKILRNLRLKIKEVNIMTQLCPKCGCSKFQLQDIDVENTPYGFMSIQCKGCGYPIGVTTVENVPATLVEYGKKILDKLDSIESKFNQK